MSLKLKYAYLALIFLVQQAGACETSDIFAYGDPKTCTNIRVSLGGIAGDGSAWSSSNVTLNDYDTLKKLYKNQEIMVHFGDGTTLKKEAIQSRMNLWTTRAASGHPHGAWIIRGDDDNTPMGLMATGAHTDPGTCELSRMLLPDFQKLRLGSSVMETLVKVWAPAARAGGLQTHNPLMAEKFKCFRGEPLSTLYVSSSPANVASWKSQVRGGFSAKKTLSETGLVDLKPQDEATFLDFTTGSVDIYAQVEQALLDKFEGPSTFRPDVLYPMIDPQGDLRTFSLSSKYNKIKYHFTYTVPDPQ